MTATKDVKQFSRSPSHLLKRAAQYSNLIYMGEVGKSGLTHRQFTVLLAVYTIPRIAQVQIMYLAHMSEPSFSAGPESLEVMMVGWDDIPWDDIAFPSVTWALQQYRSVEGVAEFAPFSNPAGAFDGL